MGGCVSNKNDIIEVRINNPSERFTNAFNNKKTKKHKSMPVTTFKFNKAPEFKQSKKSVKTLCLNDISGIRYISDKEDNFSMNENNTFKKIIEIF